MALLDPDPNQCVSSINLVGFIFMLTRIKYGRYGIYRTGTYKRILLKTFYLSSEKSGLTFLVCTYEDTEGGMFLDCDDIGPTKVSIRIKKHSVRSVRFSNMK